MPQPPLRLVRQDEIPPAVARARAERSVRRVQATLALSVVALTVLGLLMVLSASSVSAFAEFGSSFLFLKRQSLFAVIGSGAALAASRMRYQTWQRAWAPLLAVTLALLVMVLRSG